MWLDLYQGFEGVLHIRNFDTNNEIVSPVPIGNDMSAPFYRANDQVAMTAKLEGMDSVYSVIDVKTGNLLDEVLYTKPQLAQYDAYGIDGNDVYLVVEDEGKMIYTWTAGTGSPTPIGAIDDTGINLGAWIDFTLVEYGGSLKLLALGTLGAFTIDLGTMNATKVPLPIVPLEFGITDVGIAAIDGFDLWFYAWGDTQARAIHDELEASDYVLNSTFYNSHYVGSGGAAQDVGMDGSTIYYASVSGVHGYDVLSNEVKPVLLNDMTYSGSDVFIHYTDLGPDTGSMVVIGLESTNGSTGADGPYYRVRPLP
ncbi:MAG: hypothetical protein KC431_13310 [Myxococcales bacterium]|nr:hypothetical protein [Myxococcales bacterium]